MPIQYINTGSSANAGNGDSIRLAFDKVNRNFRFVDTSINDLANGYLTSLHIANTATIRNLTVTGTTYLNTVESATFHNQTYFENITVSNTSTLNLITANDAKIDTLEVLTSLSVGSYQIAAINDYNDFSIIKNDATGLAVVLLNTNADSNSKLIVKDNISGGLAILHQNLTNLAGDFVPGENYIYGETPTDVIHIGAYSDIKFSASEARYYNPLLPETPSMVIQSIDGTVHVYSSATFHSDVYGIAGAGANAGTLDRLTSQDLSKVVILNNNGSLVPSADLTYDLGSTSSQWRSLYVGTSTIYLGGTALSVVGNTLTIDGRPIQASGGGTADLGKFVFDSDGDSALITTTNDAGANPNRYDIVLVPGGEGNSFIRVPNQANSLAGNPLIIGATADNSSVAIETNSGTFSFSNLGLSFPQGSIFGTGNDDGEFILDSAGNKPFSIYTYGGPDTHRWKFGADGVLTLPSGNTRIGNVFDSDAIVGNTGTSVGVLSLGQGGYAALQWIDDPEDATSVAAVVVNSPIASTSGTVQIVTGIVGGPTAENVWEFGTDGNLTVPDDIQDANGSVIRVASTSTAPTRVDGQFWFDNVDGRLYIKNNGVWLDASPTEIPSPETYLDGLAIDGTVISTANVDGDAIVIDGGDNTKLSVSNLSVTIQTLGSGTVPSWWSMYGDLDRNLTAEFGAGSVYDGDGNLYVVGTFQTEGPDNLLLIKYDSTGQVLWSKSYANNSGGSQIYGESIIFNSVSGNLFILTTQENSWFGIIEMTTEGNIVRWVHGDISVEITGTDLTIDPSGNIYVMANHGDVVDGQGTDYLIIKLDAPTLDVVWAKSLDYGATVYEPNQGQGFGALEYSNGYIYATGGVGVSDEGGNLAYLVKLDATDGSLDWGTDAPGLTGMGLCLDDSDNVYITLINDGLAGATVIAKFNSSGTFQWAQQLMLFQGGGDVDINYDLGYLYATGVVYDERPEGPSSDGQPGWIHWAKVNATTGDIVYQQKFGNATTVPLTDVWRFYGHDLGGVYDGRLSISAFAYESTGTTSSVAANMITLQLPLTHVTTGTYGQYEITDFVTTSTSFTTTNSFSAGMTITVATYVLEGSETFINGSTSTVVVDNTLTFYTQAIGETSNTTSTVSTWTFVNNNIILPPGGDILDSNGVSVLGATTGTTALGDRLTAGSESVVLGTDGVLTLPNDMTIDASVSFGIVTIGGENTQIRIDDGGAPPGFSIVTDAANAAHTWRFDPDGVLTLSTASTILGSGTDPNVYIETITTATTSTWTFGTDGVLTLPAATPVIKGGGTGTDVTVIATTGTNTSTWTFAADGTTTFPGGYLKVVADGANPYISNRTDNGLGLVSGSAVQIRQSTADNWGITIDSSTTDSLGGGAELASGSAIDVNGTKIILGQYVTNYLDANTGLTNQNKIEINNNEILIGLKVSTITSGTTTSTFSGWTFSNTGTLTFPDATVQHTAYTTGQTTVALNGSTEGGHAGFTVGSLTDTNVIYFIAADGYSTSTTHQGTIPSPGYPGQKLTLINDHIGNVNVVWPYGESSSSSITLAAYDNSELTAINHPTEGLIWWETNHYAW